MEAFDLAVTVQEALDDADAVHYDRGCFEPMLPTDTEMLERIAELTKEQIARALFILAHRYEGMIEDSGRTEESLLEWIETGRFNHKPVDLTLLRMELHR